MFPRSSLPRQESPCPTAHLSLFPARCPHAPCPSVLVPSQVSPCHSAALLDWCPHAQRTDPSLPHAPILSRGSPGDPPAPCPAPVHPGMVTRTQCAQGVAAFIAGLSWPPGWS